MNVLLIQPPDPVPAVAAIEPTPADSRSFSPPWNLMCVQAYLLEHTRHVGHLIDCRLHTAVEQELIEAINSVPEPRFAAVSSSVSNLGQAAAILEIVKRYFPNTKTALMGEHPSQFPHEALLPRADFALSGDPEPILRNVVDYLGMDQRLSRVPGLIYATRDDITTYWLPTLKGLSAPDWEAFFWRGYQLGLTDSMYRASARLSRGHTRLEADRAFGNNTEPLRIWSFDKLAVNLQRCSIPGITEVFLEDPPGFWTLERLGQWCAALSRVRNMQPWSLQLLPAILSVEVVRQLYSSRCRRVQFFMPSCDPEILEKYYCTVSDQDLAHTVEILREYDIQTHLRFCVGGPEERSGEEARILKRIRSLGYCSFSLRPFPFRIDAPMYEEVVGKVLAPKLSDWMEWAWDPWNVDRPIPFWGGQERADETREAMTRIQFAVQRSPSRLFRKALRRLASRNWIQVVEEKSTGMMPHHTHES